MLEILIVEDDESILQILHEYICEYRKHRCCETASTIQEALNKIEHKRYHIILLDIMLDGLCTPIIKRAREIDPTTKLILMTGMHHSDVFAKEHNVDLLIMKPFNLDIIDENIPEYPC